MSITTADNSDTTSTNPSPDSSNAQAQQQTPTQPPKRSSRRANTAERRATHNAVERARRETLNGRFLDLAAMLPNLANVRRPSKSAIVNSSIALIQSQRRNRIIAAREARLFKAENDALRQELNEWRQRANMPRVEEPPRSAELLALLNLNEEEEGADTRAEFDGNYNLDDVEEYAEDDEEQQSPDTYAPYTVPGPISVQLPVTHNQQQHHAHLQQQQAVLAQKAALVRASQAQVQAQAQLAANRLAQQSQQQVIYGADFFSTDSFSLQTPVDNAQLFGTSWPQVQQKLPVTPQLVTPPGSAHGLTATKPSPFATTANQAFLASYAQNGLGLGMFHTGPGSALEDDNLSIGSGSSHHDGASSHFSAGAGSPEMMMGTSPVDHTFAFAPNAAYGVQARRPSLNIPAHAYLQTGSSPNQTQAPFLMV